RGATYPRARSSSTLYLTPTSEKPSRLPMDRSMPVEEGSTMADSKRLRLAWTAAVLAVLVITPLVVVAADRFEDVPDSNIFHDDIGWLADAGVTRGCNPPENTRFCPDDGVTRAQMAAFMRRLAENR